MKPNANLTKEPFEKNLIMSGAAGENRTHDPSLTKGVRYHYATAARCGCICTVNLEVCQV